VAPAKVRVLGRALASGLLAEDEATVDTEMLILVAMADIEAPDLSLLELLACRVPPLVVGEAEVAHPRLNRHGIFLPRHRWTQVEVGLYRYRLKPVLPSLLGILQRHGLIMQDDNMTKAMVNMSEAMQQQAGLSLRWLEPNTCHHVKPQVRYGVGVAPAAQKGSGARKSG
jgi:hypothetical protein